MATEGKKEKIVKQISKDFLHYIYQHRSGQEEFEIYACFYTGYLILKDSLRKQDGTKPNDKELIQHYIRLTGVALLLDRDLKLNDLWETGLDDETCGMFQ